TENIVLGNTCWILPWTSSGASLRSTLCGLTPRVFVVRLRIAITSSSLLLFSSGATFCAAVVLLYLVARTCTTGATVSFLCFAMREDVRNREYECSAPR